MQNITTSFVNTIFLPLVGLIFVVVYASYVHWSIGLAYLLTIPIASIFIFSMSRRIKKAQTTIVLQSADLSGSTTETLRNIELVRSLGLENQEISRLNDSNEKILQLELKKIKLIRLLSFIQGTTINAIRALLMFLMLFLLFHGNITIGEFFSLFIYSFSIAVKYN